jgi:hypothetical protein
MTKKLKIKIPVSERAVIARINRRIAKGGEMLRSNRSALKLLKMGERPLDPLYYVVNPQRNAITGTVHDLEAFAQECGVMEPWEVLAE